MILEIILALIIGVIAGTFSGLSPGIHINLISTLLISSLNSFSFLPLLAISTFIVAMSVTHTFIDFIPSIFLGAPEEDTFLSVLPGHQMVQEGRGYEAVITAMKGCLTSTLIVIILTPLFVLVLPRTIPFVKILTPFILIFISLFIILRDNKFLVSMFIFTLSGLLGYLTFNLPVKEPLLPLLTGLFGTSSLILSLKNNSRIAIQSTPKLREIKMTRKSFIKCSLTSLITAPIGSFLPGLGSGHAATVGSEIIEHNKKEFIFLNGALSTSTMILSFVTFFAIGKTRTGSAAAIKTLLPAITQKEITILIIIAIVVSFIAFFLGLILTKIATKTINKINYKILTLIILLIILLVNILITNLLGFVVLIIATLLGIFTIRSSSRRINLMGAKFLPSIIYYFVN